MKRRFFCLIAFAALALAGCASAPGPNCVRLSARGFFCLLAPAALAPQSGTDLVAVTHRGKTEHYVGQLSITSKRIELALTSLAGMPLTTMIWDGNEARMRAPKTKLDPRRLAALLQLMLASPDALRTALHGLNLAIRETAAGNVRELFSGDTLVAKAVTSHGAIRVEVPRLKLSILLQSVGGNGQ